MTIWKFAPVIGAALAIGVSATAQAANDTPVRVPSKAVDALVAKTKDGLATATVPSGSNVTVLLAHRKADGEVEVHKALSDEIIVRSGHATIRIGGTVTGQRQTGPGEFRGGTMTGGQTFDLDPGDAVYVPVGQPHQVLVPKGGDIVYFAAKYPG
jgi:mannose-6-phosphate isomerase-like protein (cupin superfamily)